MIDPVLLMSATVRRIGYELVIDRQPDAAIAVIERRALDQRADIQEWRG